MHQNKHSGSNIKVTDFTKEVIKRAAAMMEVSEIKLVSDLVEAEYPKIAKVIRKRLVK